MATITVTEPGTTVVVGDGDKVVIDIPGGGDVTIVADPNDNVDKFTIEFVDDTQADTANIDLSTFSENDLHIDIKKYDPTDTINLTGAFNRYVDPNETDEYTFDYVGADGQTYSAFVHAKDNGEKDFLDPNSPIIICFGAGTLIETDTGPLAVELLRTGDCVKTWTNETEPVRWIGCSRHDSLSLARSPELRPIRVRGGAFGGGLPYRDLILSPNHRVLISDWRAELLFGEDEVLVPIKALIDGDRIAVDDTVASVAYYHLLLDRHRVIFSNGLPTESLLVAGQSLAALSAEASAELHQIFGRAGIDAMLEGLPDRPIVKTRDALAMSA